MSNHNKKPNVPPGASPECDDQQESSVSSELSSEDDLELDGELIRNPGNNATPSDEEDTTAKRPAQGNNKKQKTGQHQEDSSSDMLQIEFTFCDMAEKFFHGLKNLLHRSSTIYEEQSSNLSDLMIQNVSVGTVVSTSSDTEDNVFGFASVLNVSTYQKASGIQHLKRLVLDSCPRDRHEELRVILSGTTQRPAGFLLHGRMLNLPLELVLTLHQQLVQDMDWAVEHAEGGKEEQKSLDFGLLVRLAPCQSREANQSSSSLLYKFFDDEVLAGRAEFVCEFTYPPKSGESGQVQETIAAMVLTKAGHRSALDDIAKMVNSS